jgi:hypothetical protein
LLQLPPQRPNVASSHRDGDREAQTPPNRFFVVHYLWRIQQNISRGHAPRRSHRTLGGVYASLVAAQVEKEKMQAAEV